MLVADMVKVVDPMAGISVNAIRPQCTAFAKSSRLS